MSGRVKLVYNDSSHSYWLAGKRVKSASKVAQIAADSFTIEQWRGRQHVIGMTLDPTLRERAAVDLDNREAIQQIADDALNAAKANARAQRGTQRHRVFELGLLGETSKFITDQQKADWQVLERTLDAYQLEPIVDRVEQFVAWPEHGVVGRYDAYLYAHALGMPILVDLKGGENAVKYPHSTAVQLWLYRNAPHTSKTIVRNGDKSEVTEWTVHPEYAATDFAYVIYCDDHHDVGELWTIDLNAARSGGELALGIVDWRKSYNYGRDIASQLAAPVGSPDGEQPSTGEPVPSPVDIGPLAKQIQRKIDTLDALANHPDVVAATERAIADDIAHEDRRATLRSRYDLLNDEQKADYTARKQAIDTNDLDAVERLLDEVEPFQRVVERIVLAPSPSRIVFMNNLPPDEGPPADDDMIVALQREFERLSDEAKFWIASLTAQGRKAGVDWRPNARKTWRRYELARAVVKIALFAIVGAGGGIGYRGDSGLCDDIVRGLLGAATGREEVEQESLALGAAIGTLDYAEAARFAALVDDYLSTGSAA